MWRSKACLAAAGMAAFMSVAHAVTLDPGANIPVPGTTVAAEPQLAGTVVEDQVTPFSYAGWFTDPSGTTNGTVSGTVQSRVVLSTDGTYDFYWRVTVDPGSFLSVSDLNLSGIPTASYNANWRSDGLGDTAPALASEDHAGHVGWYFGWLPDGGTTTIGAGHSSYFVFLDTDAHAYNADATYSLESDRSAAGPGSMMIDWGGSSGEYTTFAPAPVPEPATVAELALGLAALAWAGRRRRA